ncbi:MAG: transcriptional regulator [Chloroflexi bacterium]|nr:transcriptional regulator [Chloroflexota bacterium]
MSTKMALTIRAKKLGLLLRDAREAAGRTKAETGAAIGVSAGTVTSIETGRRSPSLPELELLCYVLDLPLEHFWSEDIISSQPDLLENIHIEHSLSMRDRGVGRLLEQARQKANLSLKDVREKTGIPQSRVKNYESGDSPTPLPELEMLARLYGLTVLDFVDPGTPVGMYILQQRAAEDFRRLPLDVQAFISKPVNRPYLELAMKLSGMSAGELRAVAEGLLEITI